MGGTLVLGAGLVGRAVAAAAERPGPCMVLSRRDAPELGQRGPQAVETVRSAIEAIDADLVVNTVGLLTGPADEVAAANEHWARWLAHDVLLGGSARLVHLGSAAEYGDPGSAHPVAEDHPLAPAGTYGTTKHAGSQAVLAARVAGLDAVVVRAFNLVGPVPAAGSPLRQFLDDVEALPAEGGIVEVWDPATTRDFIDEADLARAVLALGRADDPPPVVNACTGVAIRFAEVVEALARVRAKHVEVRSLDRPGIRAVVGDPSLLARTTGLRPTMTADRLAGTVGA